jgi:uncharacterized protein YjbI with pentapeptide repeats
VLPNPILGATLGATDLGEADLRRANLSRADLGRANVTGAAVTDDQLARARSLEGTILPDGSVHE